MEAKIAHTATSQQQDQVFNTTETNLKKAITASWSKIPPCWPLKNMVAVNPMSGFEDLPFDKACEQADRLFRQQNIPTPIYDINRLCIKWLQVYFDEGQASIAMPLKHQGLFKSIVTLLNYDGDLAINDKYKKSWLMRISKNNNLMQVIAECLLWLGIASDEQEIFLTLLLTTLPGWVAYIQYLSSWEKTSLDAQKQASLKEEYLAIRLVILCLVWPEAKQLISWYKNQTKQIQPQSFKDKLTAREQTYHKWIRQEILKHAKAKTTKLAEAQMVFCIDVRSEPLRQCIEAQGPYETLGFAGFFGVPIQIKHEHSHDLRTSCPVLLEPAHLLHETCTHKKNKHHRAFHFFKNIKKLYQTLKYNFTTPFVLVEVMGLFCAVNMLSKSIFPRISGLFYKRVKQVLGMEYDVRPEVSAIPLQQQIQYAANVLKTLDLTKHLSPLVVFCGHGSSCVNNAYASTLHCGACGGQRGLQNARVIADILNRPDVKKALEKENILIPKNTVFLAAEHDTVTDDIKLFLQDLPEPHDYRVTQLMRDLEKSSKKNRLQRLSRLQSVTISGNAKKITESHSFDWAQIRPEWGLARNAVFIIGPRWLSREIDLNGRAFLHSYNWVNDFDHSILNTILTAPMIVAQWINMQYFFSAMDNIAFGAGSKVTKNITGKVGVMQGNASDLMHGLPLQSTHRNDQKKYHDPMRLLVVIYAPSAVVLKIIQQEPALQKLICHSWIHCDCYDPKTKQYARLLPNLTWQVNAT